ncbi:MAG TPA: hypothetical protein VKE88_01050 [Candidatus Nanoarchaeia archaeon]|nr:hypothetical protein [Candidatus Nanoarchaeia archaeon]
MRIEYEEFMNALADFFIREGTPDSIKAGEICRRKAKYYLNEPVMIIEKPFFGKVKISSKGTRNP